MLGEIQVGFDVNSGTISALKLYPSVEIQLYRNYKHRAAIKTMGEIVISQNHSFTCFSIVIFSINTNYLLTEREVRTRDRGLIFSHTDRASEVNKSFIIHLLISIRLPVIRQAVLRQIAQKQDIHGSKIHLNFVLQSQTSLHVFFSFKFFWFFSVFSFFFL